jgi:2-polyprenyl-3-methyl-5-hydroxy-6-metoxy-1,4-benzoquinol methylase
MWQRPAMSCGGPLEETMCESSSYPLGYSENEASRLASQAAFLEDLTVDVLRRAGIRSGMKVLDLGCGVGDVSVLAARMVGESGEVLGIDRAASSVEKARRRAAALGTQSVRFETAELDAFDSAEKFDAVIGRLVLLYQPDPISVLRRFRNFLKPDGIVAFQEMDMETASQVPTSETFTSVCSWILGGHKAGGTELNMGSKLLPTFLNAGLPRPAMIAASRAESGPDSKVYAMLAQIVESLLPLLERTGTAVVEEVAIGTLADRLRQDAVANESVTFWPRLVGAWSRLPISS